MELRKKEAFKKLTILGNAKSGISERMEAIVYLAQYLTLCYEPIELTEDDLETMHAEGTE